jgi:hypothetical protein
MCLIISNKIHHCIHLFYVKSNVNFYENLKSFDTNKLLFLKYYCSEKLKLKINVFYIPIHTAYFSTVGKFLNF